jgi:addiction module RelE/StbE family toxin
MKVVLSPQAREDLREIFLYIAEDNPHAARLVQTRIKERVAELRNNPHIGRPGRVPGTRELVILRTPYLAPYQVTGDTIQILRVYHSSRQWPESFEQR